jgi:subfamily B ATP-binding cassette protein MsbA
MNKKDNEATVSEKLSALKRVINYRPKQLLLIAILGAATAGLEGIGLGFIYPILEVAQSQVPSNNTDGILGLFVDLYALLGIPFTFEFLILGVSITMIIRYSLSFIVDWLKTILQRRYEQYLKKEAFESGLSAKISYFDEHGSDDILNAIITETRYSGEVIMHGVQLLQTLLLAMIYLVVMFYIAPEMTIYAFILLGGITYLLRNVVEPASTVGDRVAQANERLQQSIQSGMQGIRDVKLFNKTEEVYSKFDNSVKEKTNAEIKLGRNEKAIQNMYDLATVLTLFSLIYIGFAFSALDLGALGIFLLAMFRLSPLVSMLNSQVYKLEGKLSHQIRTHRFIQDLIKNREENGSQKVNSINQIEFRNVSFAYKEEMVINTLSFTVNKGEFVAFVGQSGAGKSTIISLISRFYLPDDGEILANRTPISKLDLKNWRERIAVVRQNPFIFDDTLYQNIAIANPEANKTSVKNVARMAKIDEFVDDLPNGYRSQLGDNGVKLSGGQRQRVALARALLKDADFLLLDEATSDLDSDLEQEVQSAIEEANKDLGIIAIAHQLSTISNADQIYTVEQGEIVEHGTHDELINNNGKYSELYKLQIEK